MESVTVLGSTGSIGVNTLDVIRLHSDRFQVFALTAFSQVDLLLQQCLEFKPVLAVIDGSRNAIDLQKKLHNRGLKTQVLEGSEGYRAAASEASVSTVVAAIVGAAGLEPTMAAVRSGKKILLANKESLVMAGKLFLKEVLRYNAKLLPVDSEHNAIFQCLPSSDSFKSLSQAGVRRILLTGSGGPFRQLPASEFDKVTPQQACQHPNWSMGAKISVDSATMMNKGLEYIEACWLFNAAPSQIQIVLHPQSIVHSMVEYVDGSVLAQMGVPDMRTPIANCLGWPERIAAPVQALDFTQLMQMEFSAPDEEKFRCLALAKSAMEVGRDAPAALNAANEEAVAAFLNSQLSFAGIAEVVDAVMQSWHAGEPSDIDAVKHADKRARSQAINVISAKVQQAG